MLFKVYSPVICQSGFLETVEGIDITNQKKMHFYDKGINIQAHSGKIVEFKTDFLSWGRKRAIPDVIVILNEKYE
jgi:hypothetical protein